MYGSNRSMNYLAHIYLSGKNRQIQIGNFVGDAVKGKAYNSYPDFFRKGILLHRLIDSFADTHPAVKEAVSLGKPLFGRYSAAVTDIFFDHFLALGFPQYTGQKLTPYAHRFYIALIVNYRYLPPRFQHFIWHFILTDRLGRYASRQGIKQSLDIMTRYRKIAINPPEAIVFLDKHFHKLQSLFETFFPEVQDLCRRQLNL